MNDLNNQENIPEKEARLKKRLKEIDQKLAQKERGGTNNPNAENNATMMAKGLRLGTEFIVAIIVGCAIGWGLDQLFSTLPIFLILFLILGFGAGVLNVIRASNEMSDSVKDKGQDIGFADEDEE